MRTALVTGAAGGIGRAVAEGLEADGLAVFRTDRTAGAGVHPLDVTDAGQVAAAFDAAEVAHGPVAVLVACAGIMPAGTEPSRIATTPLAEWDQVMDVNARGTFLCLREYLARCEARPVEDGRAILLSSAAAQLGGYRGSASYVASKAAILGLTKIAAREAAPLGITVNCVAAGPVETPMFEAATTPDSAAALAARIPLGGIGGAGDVAGAVRYLAGPDAAWVTGATLDVNGGYRMQ